MSRYQQLQQLMADARDECVLWPYAKSRGYSRVYDGERVRYTHAIACAVNNGPRPDGLDAVHSCGQAACVNPAHLRWATQAENEADKVLHGTTNRGERCARARLTVDEVRDIRRRCSSTSQAQLAREFQVSKHAIRSVIHRLTWAWLDAADGLSEAA